MNFKDILKEKSDKDIIKVGYNNDGIYEININTSPSIIITGETGTGKSILLDQILLQFINKYTSLELGIISIDTSGVELNYYAKSDYTLYNAINDTDKAIVALSRVLREIDRRRQLLNDKQVLTVDEYNNISNSKLPYIVVAIDDNKMLLRHPDIEKMLSGIITQLNGLNIYFVLATSDVYNKFFKQDKNLLASTLITFDYTNEQEAEYANIKGAENLSVGSILIKDKVSTKEYNTFEFTDQLINEILDK